MPLDTVKSLMAADSAFIKTCDHIRDKFAFHADKEPVMEWLNSRPPLEGRVCQLVEKSERVIIRPLIAA